MARTRSVFVCQSCGYESPKWAGRCPECGNWNTFSEEAVVHEKSVRTAPRGVSSQPIPMTEIKEADDKRLSTTLEEFDRVLGGGIVPGSVILVGGAPGMGKSTLLLQIGLRLAEKGLRILYVSGEESPRQIRMRADRLTGVSERFFLLSETDVESIAEAMKQNKPDLAVVDSIQTVFTPQLDSLPGNVSQVRVCGHALTAVAKEEQIPLFLVGHVTKEGGMAGPRVLEHLVDTLLFLEGDEQHIYRLLRSMKNRFGSTHEVGIFEMTERGMIEVKSPSEFLLSERLPGMSGTAVTVNLEGTRPILVEVQALVSHSGYGIPQRTATGVDQRRLSILLAVLEKREGLKFSTQDVFVNAAGGFRLSEPGADLAVVAALVSSAKDIPIESKTCFVGEIGLTGEVRGISQIDKRIAEAERMGFQRLVIPKINVKNLRKKPSIEVTGVKTVGEAIRILGG